MKQTQVKNFILALALVLTFSSTVLADDPYGNFAVGSGTENDPFLISTSDDLMMMSDVFRNNPTLGSVFPFYAAAYYELTDNIDMKGQYWSPISNTSTKVFLGDFNGAGYTISNLENPSLYCPGGSVGLFGYMGGKVYNLNLADIDLWSAPTGTSYGIGGVSGALHQRGVIENVNVTGKITVCDTAGRNGGGITGIVVGLDARISNSTFDGDIIGTISGVNALGGIVGYVNAYRLVVENCYSAGSITRPGAGGNLIGKIAGSPRDDTAFLNDTTSMTIDASTSSSAGWFGYDGIEVPPPSDDPGVKTGLGVRYDDSAVAVKNADRLAVATLWIKANSGTPSFAGLNNFSVLDSTKDGSLYRVTLGYLVAGGQGFTSANAGLLTISGATGVTIERAKFVSYDDNGNAVNTAYYLEKETGGGVVIPPDPPIVDTTNYDLNHDGVVDQLDLAIALSFFTVNGGDANWNTAKIADFNKDGIVDIEDFIRLLNNMVF